MQMDGGRLDHRTARRAQPHTVRRPRAEVLATARADAERAMDAGQQRPDRRQVDMLAGVKLRLIGRRQRLVAMRAVPGGSPPPGRAEHSTPGMPLDGPSSSPHAAPPGWACGPGSAERTNCPASSVAIPASPQVPRRASSTQRRVLPAPAQARSDHPWKAAKARRALGSPRITTQSRRQPNRLPPSSQFGSEQL